VHESTRVTRDARSSDLIATRALRVSKIFASGKTARNDFASSAQQCQEKVRRKSGQCQEAANAITVEQQTGLVIPPRDAHRLSKGFAISDESSTYGAKATIA
jgi:hypothetical protein